MIDSEAEVIPPPANEVIVQPGRCIAWRCEEPTDNLACPKHAKEFGAAPKEPPQYMRYLTDREREQLAVLSIIDRAHLLDTLRPRLYMRMRRSENPGYGHGRYAGNSDPLVQGRRRIILAKLHDQGHVITTDLAAEFGVSTALIGRDLVVLDREGLCHRVYGGARLDDSAEPGLRSRA